MHSNATIYHTIDWLNVTTPYKLDKRYPRYYKHDFIESNGGHGYTICREYLDGRREYMNPDRPDMGVHTQYSGQTIKNLCELHEITPYGIVAHHLKSQCKFTRVDLTLDCHNTGLDMDKIEQMIKERKWICRASEQSVLRMKKTLVKGDTIYIGRGSKYRYLRVYDKAGEMGLQQDWKRLELQCNTRTADTTLRAVMDAQDKGDTIASLIRGFCDFPEYRTWAMILGFHDIKVKVEAPEEPTTLQWLLKTCAPSLARMIALHGYVIKDDFEEALRVELLKFHSKVRVDPEHLYDEGIDNE